MIPPDDPRAVRIAALLHPASFATVPHPDPFAFDFDPALDVDLDFDLGFDPTALDFDLSGLD